MAPRRKPPQERMPQKVLAMIMAGGKGERLMPLTEQRSKPSVPFAGNYRIADFVLSNFINSGIQGMYVLVQYRSQSLFEHLRRAWRFSGPNRQAFITVVPPQMKGRGKWYEGTADAVYQNINLIRDFAPGLVAVFGADHIYRMDLRQMIQFHLDQQAEVTVAALPVPIHAAKGFGIIEASSDHQIIGPRRTFLGLIEPDELPTEFVHAIQRFRIRGSSALKKSRLSLNLCLAIRKCHTAQWAIIFSMSTR